MKPPMSPAGRPVWRGVAASLSLSLGAIGCGADAPPIPVRPVPASGIVVYQGKPLARGSVLVVPDQDGHPAAGEVEDGHFTLTTYETDDGAIPGKHKVAVIATKEEKGKTGESTTKSLLPAKFSKAETSGLVVEIPPQGTGELTIEVE